MSDERGDLPDAESGTLTPCPFCGHLNLTGATVCAGCGHGESEHDPSLGADALLANIRAMRVAAVIAGVTYVLYVAQDWFRSPVFPGSLPPESWRALEWRGIGALVWFPSYLFWVRSVLYLAGFAGLFNFGRPARLVLTLLLAADLVWIVLSGLYIETELGEFLVTAFYVSTGASLALAWTPPLCDRFRRRR